jgi:hypothetical protein
MQQETHIFFLALSYMHTFIMLQPYWLKTKDFAWQICQPEVHLKEYEQAKTKETNT